MASPLVLILNYRTARLTLECVDSLQPELAGTAHLLVVDNGSPADETEELRRGLKRRSIVDSFVSLDRNYGFAGGIARGLVQAGDRAGNWDYLWLLNSDTRVTPGALGALLATMVAVPRAGAAASRLESSGGKVWQGGFAFPSLLSEWERGAHTQVASRCLGLPTAHDSSAWTAATKVDWVPGASLLIRREAWDDVGPLRDDYFLYFEDVDWCLRAAAKGWSSYYVPRSRVVHHVGGSHSQDRMPDYWFEARRSFWVKHHGIGRSWLADWAWFLGRATAWLRRRTRAALKTDPPGLAADQWRDHVRFTKSVGGVLSSTGSAASCNAR